MIPSIKLQVLRLFLQFAQTFISLRKANLATLGGEGLEAGLWQELGVEANRGWLIERQEGRSLRLIRNFSYRYCPDLVDLPRSLNDVMARPMVDVFHLDLCGTLEPSMDIFCPLMRYIANSRGRCLAITVADQRRNLSLERFDAVWKRGRQLLGNSGRSNLFRQLQQEQQIVGTGEKGARRELGFFLNMVKLFSCRHLACLPDRIERYIYVSDMQGTPFRMRTYMFHFSKQSVEKPKLAKSLSRLWSQSRLWQHDGGCDFQQVLVEGKDEVMTEPISVPKSRLTTMAEAAGGEVWAEYQSLLAEVQLAREVRGAIDVDRLHGIFKGSSKSGPQNVSDTGDKKTRRQQAAGDQEVVRIQYDLLVAKSKGFEASKKAYEVARDALGLGGRKYSTSWRRKIGGLLAHTQGKFRPEFVRQAVAAGIDFKSLADAYGEPVGTLKAEAGIV